MSYSSYFSRVEQNTRKYVQVSNLCSEIALGEKEIEQWNFTDCFNKDALLSHYSLSEQEKSTTVKNLVQNMA